MKKIILLCLIMFFMIQMGTNAASIDKLNKVSVDGKIIKFSRELLLENDRVLVPASEFLKAIGGDANYNLETKIILLNYKLISLRTKVGSRLMVENETSSNMYARTLLYDGVVMIPLRSIVESLKLPIVYDARAKLIAIGINTIPKNISRGEIERGKKVVIDAGHGGSESGAAYGGILEKDINLEVSKKLYKKLKDEGIDVYMTRTDDTYVDLYERTNFANSIRADLFLSIHHNAGFSKEKGTMTLYYPTDNNRYFNSLDFASIIQNNLLNDLGTNNLGIIPRPNLAVLRTSNMPCALAEIGYMSNSSELSKITDDSYQDKVAESLKNAVLKALNVK